MIFFLIFGIIKSEVLDLVVRLIFRLGKLKLIIGLGSEKFGLFLVF